MEAMNAQSDSAFFRLLPPEIREKIYESLWDSETQHVYMCNANPSGPLAHAPCIIDPDAEDTREKTYEAIQIAPAGSEESHYPAEVKMAWRARQYTNWCHHWQCEEASASGSLMGPLLACKRMYDESVGVLYSRTTFSFVNTAALCRFLEVVPGASLELVRAVHLLWRDHGVLLEDGRYIDADEDPLAWSLAWPQLWSRLDQFCGRLSQVRIWYYGSLPRFPRPEDSVLDQIEDSGICRKANVTLQLVWTWDFDSFLVDGVAFQDDGAMIPDSLRGRGFRVSRTPAIEVLPRAWIAMWERPRSRPPRLRVVGEQVTHGWGVRHCGSRERSSASMLFGSSEQPHLVAEDYW